MKKKSVQARIAEEMNPIFQKICESGKFYEFQEFVKTNLKSSWVSGIAGYIGSLRDVNRIKKQFQEIL